MLSAGFETAILGTKRPQTYALDRSAIGIGTMGIGSYKLRICSICPSDVVRKFPDFPFSHSLVIKYVQTGMACERVGLSCVRLG
jgi:hypothetical protein